jgi:hypothetical protein
LNAPNAEKLEVAVDGLHWFKMLIGLLVGLFGLMFLAGPIMVGLTQNPAAFVGIICSGPAGLVFIGIGCWIGLGTSGVTLDKDTGTITEWSGLSRWKKKEEHCLEDYGRVTLKQYERTRGRDSISGTVERAATHSAFTAAIEGTGKKIVLLDWVQKDQVSERARTVAKFLQFPLIDMSERRENVIQPEDL